MSRFSSSVTHIIDFSCEDGPFFDVYPDKGIFHAFKKRLLQAGIYLIAMSIHRGWSCIFKNRISAYLHGEVLFNLVFSWLLRLACLGVS